MIRRRFFRMFLPILTLLLCLGLRALDVTIDWEKAEQVQAGTRLIRIDLEEPRLMKICLMRIDLKTPGLHFTGTKRDKDWGKPMPDYPSTKIRTKRIRTTDFLKSARKEGLDMIVAVNAAPWTPWTKPYTHAYGDPRGVTIVDGEVITDNKPQQAVFAVDKKGKTDIVRELPKSAYRHTALAVTGFSIILEDGKMLADNAYDMSLHPRTAYGLSSDRSYFYILTVDGRQKNWSIGANCRELAEILAAAGAGDAINMDGGGSSTMCFWDRRKNRPVVVNSHGRGGYLRPVASNLGIVIER